MDRFRTFTVQISRMARLVHRIKMEETAKFGLKSTHVSCLYYMYQEGGTMTFRELCLACEEDKAAVSRSVDYLKSHGYVRAEGEGYKTPLTLTETGAAVGKSLSETIVEVLAQASEGLSDENRKIFYDSLALIGDNLQAICDGFGGRK